MSRKVWGEFPFSAGTVEIESTSKESGDAVLLRTIPLPAIAGKHLTKTEYWIAPFVSGEGICLEIVWTIRSRQRT